jgi:hypothetical protein
MPPIRGDGLPGGDVSTSDEGTMNFILWKMERVAWGFVVILEPLRAKGHRICTTTNAGVLQLRFRMTTKNKQRQKQEQQQIPCGNDRKKSKNSSDSG